jgi:protein-lysine N-methyltransferase EEF2KMT
MSAAYPFQEISNELMEKTAKLSTVQDPPPSEYAKLKSILTYTLPNTSEDIILNAIFIEECPDLLAAAGTTGLRTWDACLHLGTYLATEGKSLVIGKSVLELGVGTGLLSILCAGPLSAAYVLATDGDPDVRKTLDRNINLNHHFSKTPGRQIPLEAKVLEWGSSTALGSVLPSKGGSVLYDTILGADLTYSLDSLEPLASTLAGLAELCPTADIVISAPIRNEDTFDIFLAHCLERGLSAYDIDFRCPRLELQRGFFHSLDLPIRIVRIKKEG